MNMLHMDINDVAHEYAPYHKLPEFKIGFDDYLAGRRQRLDGVEGQAYDRGAECAMRVTRHNEWVKQNVGLD
jgi:hypothetical protein